VQPSAIKRSINASQTCHLLLPQVLLLLKKKEKSQDEIKDKKDKKVDEEGRKR
jgi:hypothetical protein